MRLWRALRLANKHGRLTLQQMYLPAGMGWHCSLRSSGELKYAWTAEGMTLAEAIGAAVDQAEEYPIGGRPEMACVPKLGGAEFDE